MACIRNLFLAVLACAGLTSCNGGSAFPCAENGDCNGEPGGLCGPAGFCAFPDSSCDSEARYGDHAGSISGKCVTVDSGAGTGTETTAPTTAAAPFTTGANETSASDASTTTGPPTTSTTGATTPTSGTTTGPPTCANISEACDLDGDCCSECFACSEGTCQPKTGDPEPCPECQVCDAIGECAIDEGSVCDGAVIDCARVILGLVGTECVASTGTIAPRCSSIGLCVPAAVNACVASGAAVVSCSQACLDNPEACIPGADVASVTTEAMCKTDESDAACGGECLFAPEGYSYSPQWCGTEGHCVPGPVQEACGLYACHAGGCFTGCKEDMQCFDSTCQLGNCCQGICF